jgi:hypothetical protein
MFIIKANHHPHQNLLEICPGKAPRQEEGMAMVAALLMGVVLLAGTTGLMILQLAERKLGAAESYQQIAESAA